MKLRLESTTRTVEIAAGGRPVPARIWEGETEDGIPVFCFITRVCVRHDADRSQFEAELQAHRQPVNPDINAWPARMVL